MQPRLREPADSPRESPASAAGASPNAAGWLRILGVAAAAGVFLAMVGALGTDDLPLAVRLAYWLPLMLGGAVLGQGMSQLVARIPHARVNPWVFGALLSLMLAIPVTFVVWAYTGFVFGRVYSLRALPAMFGPVLVISAAMTAIMIMVSWPGRMTHAAPPSGAAPIPPRFLDRLPSKLKGAALYAVSSEDHYLRLHTSKGSDLILMRLADALGELEGFEGAQTHRSWWVARDAVENARRDGDRVSLALKGGGEAPVSRPNVRPLREAGWF